MRAGTIINIAWREDVVSNIDHTGMTCQVFHQIYHRQINYLEYS